jgi:predicted N-acetyltransferase YhbS
VAIDSAEGRTHALGLAPLAVLPEVQRSGVGSALVRHALAQLGDACVVVLGDPAYYGKFGFRDARESGLAWEMAGHEAHFQARGVFRGGGIVRYRPEVMGFQVRPARRDEFSAIQRLELAAAKRFKESTHPAAADLPPVSIEELGRVSVWVVSKGDALAAYVAWEPLGSDAFVIELDVHPDHAGARLGAALLDHVALLSGKRLVLRTFSDVPWNAPHYRNLGFREIETPSSIEEVVRRESLSGLSRRVTLAR